jgi:hypothetical protein
MEGEQQVTKIEFQVEEKVIKRTKDKVCIVGCADSKTIVPWKDETFEFWGVNNLYGVPLKDAHYDRWFEIHNIEYDGRNFLRRESLDFRGQPVREYLAGLAKLECPVIYMQKHWDEVPQSVPYPIQPIVAIFGRYLTNTISYELALAILMEFKEIHVYGVDMAVGTEYQNQRPSCEYFIGIAQGKGIMVYIPPEADLLKTRFLYGFEEPKQSLYAKKMKSVDSKLVQQQQQAEGQLEQAKAQMHQCIGARHAIAEMGKIWSNLGDKISG